MATLPWYTIRAGARTAAARAAPRAARLPPRARRIVGPGVGIEAGGADGARNFLMSWRDGETFCGVFPENRGECGAWGQISGETPGPRGGTPPEAPLTPYLPPPLPRGAPQSPPLIILHPLTAPADQLITGCRQLGPR